MSDSPLSTSSDAKEVTPLEALREMLVRLAQYEDAFRMMRIAAESGSREAVGAVAIGAMRALFPEESGQVAHGAVQTGKRVIAGITSSL